MSRKGGSRKSGRAIARIISGAASLVTAVVAIGSGMLPAIASELTSWNYDEQTRSLTLTLPANVTPTVSVTAPNQMLVELPDTQIGDIAGQNVGDGLVESITLKQTTSDKVWMVVNFVPGTALATQQNVVPLGGAATPEGSTPSDPLSADAGLQRWQVRPALVAGRSDNRSVSASIERGTAESGTAESDAPTAAAPSALSPEAASLQEGSAANLSDRGNAIAQTPQTPIFPELPILEPAMPINAPVSVPPIDVRPVPTQAAAPPIQTAPPVQASVPPAAPPKLTESVSAEQPTAPTIPAAPPVQASVSPIATSKPTGSAGAEQPTANSSDSQVPLEPPFIGDLEEEVNNPAIDGLVDGPVDEPAVSEPAVVASPPTSAPPASFDSPSIDSPSIDMPSADMPSADMPSADTPSTISETASEPTNSAASETITASGSNPELANAGSPEVAIPEIDIPVENAHTPSTNRWPEPIPFGQPLP